MVSRSDGFAKKCVLVLGMHRSGTSALTRMISLMGADLPQTLMGNSQNNLNSNPKGHWESETLVRFSDRILESAGNSWASPEMIPSDWYKSARSRDLKAEAHELLADEFGSSKLFVFKDPRICKMLPFWVSALSDFGAEAVVVNIVRRPGEIAKSLYARNGFDPALGELLWLRYVLEAERASRGLSRLQFTFDGLLEDWREVCDKIISDTDISWPAFSERRKREIANYISDSERHHRDLITAAPRDSVALWAATVFEIHQNWAISGEASADYQILDAIHAELDDAVRHFMGPLLVAFDKSVEARKLQKIRAEQASEIEVYSEKLREKENFAAEIATLKSQVVDLVSDNNTKSENMKFLDDQIVNLKSESLSLKERVHSGEIDNESLSKELESKNVILSEQKNLNLQLERDNSLLREMEENLRLQLKKISDENGELRDILSVTRRELDALRDSAEAKASSLERQIKKVRSKAEQSAGERRIEFAARLIELRDQMERVQRVAGERSNVIKKLRDANLRLTERRDEVQQALLAVRKNRRERIDALKANIKSLEKLLAHETSKNADLAASKIADLAASQTEWESRYRALEENHEDFVLRCAKEFYDNSGNIFSTLSEHFVDKSKKNELKETFLIRNSLFFDQHYYLDKNKDVALSGIDPAYHYVKFGAKEKRAPSSAFDGEKYLVRYKDVAASGVNPLVHYLTAGRRENRKIEAVADRPASRTRCDGGTTKDGEDASSDVHREIYAANEAKERVDTSREAPAPFIAQDHETETISNTYITPALEAEPVLPLGSFAALAHRSIDFVASVPISRPESIRLGEISVGSHHASESTVASPALTVFEALRTGRNREAARALVSSAVRMDMLDGMIKISNIWLSTDRELSILSTHSGQDYYAIRIYQATADGHVVTCFEGRIAPGEAMFARAILADRFEPLIAIVTSGDGRIVDATLFPFPSLVLGGLHYGELADQFSDTDWVLATQRYAANILEKFLDDDRTPAISRLSVDVSRALGTEPIFADDFCRWVTGRFGVELINLERKATSPTLRNVASDRCLNRTSGRELNLPATAVPTLATLVLGESELASATTLTTVIVSRDTMRPERHIRHPIETVNISGLNMRFSPALDDIKPHPAVNKTLSVWIQSSPPVHTDVRALFPALSPLSFNRSAAPQELPAGITALIRCTGDRSSLETLLRSLANQSFKGRLEVILIGDPPVDDLAALQFRGVNLMIAKQFDGWTFDSFFEGVRSATNSLIMCLRDRMVLHDTRTLAVLALLANEEDVGSVGCLMAHEVEADGASLGFSTEFSWTEVRRGKGGASLECPRLDSSQLPAVAAVAANRLGCMMVNKEALLQTVGIVERDLPLDDFVIAKALRAVGTMNIATPVISAVDQGWSSTVAPDLDEIGRKLCPYMIIEEY